MRVVLIFLIIGFTANPMLHSQVWDGEVLTSLEEVIQAYIKANGGQGNIDKIKSMRILGKNTEGERERSFVIIKKGTNLIKIIIKQPHVQVHLTYDGKSAWRRIITPEHEVVELMKKEETRDLIEEADFHNPLTGYQERGYEVELLGQEKVNDMDCYKIRVNREEEETFIYLDGLTFREILRERMEEADGQLHQVSIYMSDYREISDFWFPFLIEKYINEKAFSRMIIESTELNVGIFDSYFEKPRGVEGESQTGNTGGRIN